MEIKKTYDYSKFKFLSYNRAVGSNKKLMRSIEMANLTSVCPIIVTPSLEIIDGQNRFEVCKSKGMPIFYVVYEGDAETAMKALNTCSQPWRQEEWMQYYLAKGVPNYVALKDFMDMYNLPISNAILIFSNGSTNAATFKKGMLNRTGKYHNEIAIFLNDIASILPRDIVSFRAFVNGVMLFFNEFEGDKRKVEKLKKKIASIYKYSRTEDYLNAFRNYVK